MYPVATVIIYQDKPDNWQHHAPTQEMRNYGGATKKIIYINGALCVLDNEPGARLAIIPLSRWKLAQTGLNCIMAALRR
jgi:hypothetical protein